MADLRALAYKRLSSCKEDYYSYLPLENNFCTKSSSAETKRTSQTDTVDIQYSESVEAEREDFLALREVFLLVISKDISTKSIVESEEFKHAIETIKDKFGSLEDPRIIKIYFIMSQDRRLMLEALGKEGKKQYEEEKERLNSRWFEGLRLLKSSEDLRILKETFDEYYKNKSIMDLGMP